MFGIQGSKLSSLLYTLYINEVPLLSKLIGTEIYRKLTGDSPINSNNISDHTTIQYVDDSNNIITSDSSLGVAEYINKYFRMLESYYNLNKLKLNPDKSKLMLVCKPNKRQDISTISLVTSEHTIEHVTKIKALGI